MLKGGIKNMACKNVVPINKKIVKTLPKKGVRFPKPAKGRVKIKPFC